MSTLLDSSVVSEVMRALPDPAVARCVSSRPLENLCLAAVREAELRYGAKSLPSNRRRETLLFKMEAMLGDGLEDRVLPFDSEAARWHVYIAAARRSAGRPVASADCQIAALAAAHRVRMATRNARDFEDRIWESRSTPCQGMRAGT